MTTYMQEEIDVDAIPRKTDVPVCTTMTRLASKNKDKDKHKHKNKDKVNQRSSLHHHDQVSIQIKDKDKDKSISHLYLFVLILKWTPHTYKSKMLHNSLFSVIRKLLRTGNLRMLLLSLGLIIFWWFFMFMMTFGDTLLKGLQYFQKWIVFKRTLQVIWVWVERGYNILTWSSQGWFIHHSTISTRMKIVMFINILNILRMRFRPYKWRGFWWSSSLYQHHLIIIRVTMIFRLCWCWGWTPLSRRWLICPMRLPGSPSPS